jgi:alcohol dehydrogenase YqhD (iron-dependent ADH family)
MNNFTYYNPTKIIFGKDTQNQVGEEIKAYGKKVLLHYGSERIKSTDLYTQIINSLKENNLELVELGGVVPNPRLSLVYEGIKLCKDEKIDFILAVGGGSVIDSAKAISGGVKSDQDIWKLIKSNTACLDCIPLGTILTLPATGTEMNGRCVISNEDTLEKRGTTFANPVFSILNADLCATLPKNQVANGAIDMLSHCLERYFTNTKNVEVTDRLLEGNMKAIVSLASDVYKDPTNYNKYSQLMWAGTMAHNFILCVGRETDWASHQIEHELSGMYDVPHGAGLAVVFPAWMEYTLKHNPNRLAMLGVNVFGVEADYMDVERTARQTIKAFRVWLKSLDMPLTLGELDIPLASIPKLAKDTTRNDTITQGTYVKLTSKDVEEILKLAL